MSRPNKALFFVLAVFTVLTCFMSFQVSVSNAQTKETVTIRLTGSASTNAAGTLLFSSPTSLQAVQVVCEGAGTVQITVQGHSPVTATLTPTKGTVSMPPFQIGTAMVVLDPATGFGTFAANLANVLGAPTGNQIDVTAQLVAAPYNSTFDCFATGIFTHP